MTVRLLQPLDDADVAHGAVAERFERLLVFRAVMRSDRLFDRGEFAHHGTRIQTGLEGGQF